jgi:hypothetical protein
MGRGQLGGREVMGPAPTKKKFSCWYLQSENLNRKIRRREDALPIAGAD